MEGLLQDTRRAAKAEAKKKRTADKRLKRDAAKADRLSMASETVEKQPSDTQQPADIQCAVPQPVATQSADTQPVDTQPAEASTPESLVRPSSRKETNEFEIDQLCAMCGLASAPGSKWPCCGKCRLTRYCCAQHQRDAWKRRGHTRSCGQPLPTRASLEDASTEELAQVMVEFGPAHEPLAIAIVEHALSHTMLTFGFEKPCLPLVLRRRRNRSAGLRG